MNGFSRFVIVLSVAMFAVPIMAQDYPRAEIFGGYSYVRVQEIDMNMHGWNFSIAGNLSSWFGIVGDISGQYGKASEFGVDVDLNLHSFLFGPKIAGRGGKVTTFVQALFGYSRASAGADIPGMPGVSVNEGGLGIAAGGGIDVNAGTRLAIRVVQADYLHLRSEGEGSNNYRVSAGLVCKF